MTGWAGQRRPRRLGLRREVVLFLPTALLLLVAVSTFAALAYARGLERLAATRRDEAARLARAVAAGLDRRLPPAEAALLRAAPGAAGAALLGANGRPLAASGVFSGALAGGDLAAPIAGERPAEAVATGPGAATPGTVAAFAPLEIGGQPLLLRVDLPAAELAAQLARSRHLARAVVALDLAVGLLILLFLRRLLAPWEGLLDRARRLGGEPVPEQDEEAFLLSIFERALREAGRHPATDEIAAAERALLASVQSGLLLLDDRGRLLAANPVAGDLLRLDDAALGRPAAAALAAHPELAAAVAAGVGGTRVVQRQECGVERAGERRTVGVSVHPLRRDDGGARGHIVLFADLTEARRRAERERLAASLAELGELAAGVAHELRNGLATVRGYLALMRRRAPAPPEAAHHLAEAERETAHLERVVADFLTFARPGSARPEPVDLAAIAHRAAADPTLAAPATVRVEAAAVAVRALGDPTLLARAVRNLLSNAVAAQRDGGACGPVEVSLRRAGPGELELTVADRGPGVPSGLRPRLFEPFATGRPGGTGMGLAVARRIVLLHGGRIELRDRPGGGTLAILNLPVDNSDTEGNTSDSTATASRVAPDAPKSKVDGRLPT